MTVSGTETTHEVVENTQDEDFLLNIVHVVQPPGGSATTTTEYGHLATRHMELNSDLTYVMSIGGIAATATDGTVDSSGITANETFSGTSAVFAVTGVDHFGQAWPQTGEFYQGEAPLYVPPGDYQPPPTPGSYPPNPSRTSTLLGWLAGSHGDVFDQTVNFASGFGDNVTFGASKAMRKWHGMDYVNQDSWAYTGGDFAANFVPGPNAIARPGTLAYKLYNKFDDLGDCASFMTKVVHGGCFVPGTLVTLSELPRDASFEAALWGDGDFSELSQADRLSLSGTSLAAGSSLASLVTLPARSLRLPIEQVPLGAREPTKNPKPWEYDDSLPEPDEATWAVVSFTVERSDGGLVDAELLRPRTWIERHGIAAGQLLPLNIEELQIQGLARVNSVAPAPRLASGEGSAVTGRFITRQVDIIARIEVLGADGQVETIEGTTIHPVWSVDRDDWVPLGELAEGELLLGAAGPAVVLSHITLQRSTPVYNIEVHGEHVYEVGELGLLVHNTYAPVKGFGNIGSHAPMASGDALNHGIKFLGAGYKEIAPDVFRSADGLRQFRMTTADLLGTHGKIGPHVHIEALDKLGRVIENLHLPIF